MTVRLTGWTILTMGLVASGPAFGQPMPIEASALYPSGAGLVFVREIGDRIAIPFEGTQAEVAKIAQKLWGMATDSGTMAECGAGPIDFLSFENGVSLHFMNETFLGWAMNSFDGGIGVMPGGFSIGTSRSELETMAGELEVFESTLGTEFSTADAVFGIFSESGSPVVVESLWAGVSCNFR